MRLARLTQRKQFLAAADRGRRFRSSAFTVQVLDVSPAREAEGSDARDHDGLRLGLTASRKVGNAVKRNRIRRRLRVAAQQALAEQADRPCDVVARAETLTAGFRTLVGELSVAIERARPQGQGRKARPGKAGARIADTRPQSQSN
jgi:ribonuclease P protein component